MTYLIYRIFLASFADLSLSLSASNKSTSGSRTTTFFFFTCASLLCDASMSGNAIYYICFAYIIAIYIKQIFVYYNIRRIGAFCLCRWISCPSESLYVYIHYIVCCRDSTGSFSYIYFFLLHVQAPLSVLSLLAL